jgi:hypothetical protein
MFCPQSQFETIGGPQSAHDAGGEVQYAGIRLLEVPVCRYPTLGDASAFSGTSATIRFEGPPCLRHAIHDVVPRGAV